MNYVLECSSVKLTRVDIYLNSKRPQIQETLSTVTDTGHLDHGRYGYQLVCGAEIDAEKHQ